MRSTIINHAVHYLRLVLTLSGASSLRIPLKISIIFVLLVFYDLMKRISVAVDVLNHIVIPESLWVDKNKVNLIFHFA